MTIEGIPDGWELVRIGQVIDGEHYLGMNGKILLCEGVFDGKSYVVIRKIEQAPKYRPFESAEEFEPHRNRWVQVVKEDNMSSCDLEEHAGGPAKIVAYNGDSVCVYGGWITYDEAFECFVFDGGTPFGIEVTE